VTRACTPIRLAIPTLTVGHWLNCPHSTPRQWAHHARHSMYARDTARTARPPLDGPRLVGRNRSPRPACTTRTRVYVRVRVYVSCVITCVWHVPPRVNSCHRVRDRSVPSALHIKPRAHNQSPLARVTARSPAAHHHQNTPNLPSPSSHRPTTTPSCRHTHPATPPLTPHRPRGRRRICSPSSCGSAAPRG